MHAEPRFKVHHADTHARLKGFRPGRIYRCVGVDRDANPEHGPLYLLRNRVGRTEGFYADQGRWVIRITELESKHAR